MKHVLVLGTSGMLGAMVTQVLTDVGFSVSGTSRRGTNETVNQHKVRQYDFDATAGSNAVMDLLRASRPQWVVNCIGIIKPYITESNSGEVQRAITVNGSMPHWLAAAAEEHGARVIQIATDCVYSGRAGQYKESAPHDALDVYGKTKSLGEVRSKAVHHLRCSIIGPELKSHRSLLDWFRHQPHNAVLSGYTNHDWNGITTLQFAKLCVGIVRSDVDLPHLHHVVPSAPLSKHEMLQAFGEEFDRPDIVVNAVEAPDKVDRTLDTEHPDPNCALWRHAGYSVPPTVREMIAELALHFRG